MTPRVTLAEALFALTTEREALLRRTRALSAAIDALEELQIVEEEGLANEALDALHATLGGPVAAPVPIPQTLREELLALPPLPRPSPTEAPADDEPVPVVAPHASVEPLDAVGVEGAAVDPRRDVDADQAILVALAGGYKTLTQLGKLAKKRGEPLKKAVDRTNYRLQRLLTEGKVLRIQRGLYALPPPAKLTYPTTRHEDQFEVAWNGSMKTPLPGVGTGGLGSSLSAEAGLVR